jgi:hypothetical protein
MSKHLNNLERLSVKLQRCFGEDDALLQLVKRELAEHQIRHVPAHRPQGWGIPYHHHVENRRGATLH